jgi:Fe2+ transport system protein FeoA
MITQLCCAKQGDKCLILNLKGNTRSRLAELGFTTGNIVEIIQHNGNGPIKVKVFDGMIALRHSEAESITVDVILK